jgi:plasmid stability protein
MQIAWSYAERMKTLQVRNVPDDLHTTLKVRAAQSGMSLSEFVLAELQRVAERPTRAELLARLRTRPRVRARVDAAALVRAERDAR